MNSTHNICPICFDEYTKCKVTELECSHKCHTKCLHKYWYTIKNKMLMDCPYCRDKIYYEDLSNATIQKYKNKKRILKEMIDNCSNLTPFMMDLLNYASEDITIYAIEKCSDLTVYYSEYQLIHIALCESKFQVAMALLKSGRIDLEAPTMITNTRPIHYAFINDETPEEIIDYLISSGVDLNVTTRYDKSVIWYLNHHNHLIKLIEAGYDIHRKTCIYPLHELAMIDSEEFSSLDLIIELLNRGVDINYSDENNFNAVYHAAYSSNWPAVSEFIKRGANLDNGQTSDGNHLIHLVLCSCYTDHNAIVPLIELINAGMPIHYKNANGETGLEMLMKKHHYIDYKFYYLKDTLPEKINELNNEINNLCDYLIEKGAQVDRNVFLLCALYKCKEYVIKFFNSHKLSKFDPIINQKLIELQHQIFDNKIITINVATNKELQIDINKNWSIKNILILRGFNSSDFNVDWNNDWTLKK